MFNIHVKKYEYLRRLINAGRSGDFKLFSANLHIKFVQLSDEKAKIIHL